MDREAANAIVRDPHADPALLARVAHEVPELRAAVAAHPAAYPGLLDWLGQLGDPAIDMVVGARTGSGAAPSTGGAAAAPGTVDTPETGGTPAARPRWLLGVAGVVVLALVGGGAALALRDGGSATSGELLVPYPKAPTAWEIDVRDLTRYGEELMTLGFTPSHYVAGAREDDRLVVAGFDLSTQALDWDVTFEGAYDSECRTHVASTVMFCRSDNRIIAIDARTGEEISSTPWRIGTYIRLLAHADGTATYLTVNWDGRTSPAEVTRIDSAGSTLWSVVVDEPTSTDEWTLYEDSLSGDIRLEHRDADYEWTAWLVDEGSATRLPSSPSVTFRGDYAVEMTYPSEGPRRTEVREVDGPVLLDLTGHSMSQESVMDWGAGRPLVSFDEDRYEVVAWDRGTTDPAWTFRARELVGLELVTAGFVVVRTESRRVVLDRRDGTELWDAPREDWGMVRTDGDRLIVREERDVTAFDLRTGDRVWRESIGSAFRDGWMSWSTNRIVISSEDRLLLMLP